MAVFVDSTVLIDVLSDPSPWRPWSAERLLEWAERGPLLINDIVYAEVSIGFERQADLDRHIEDLGLERIALDREALFAAGKAFRAYRQSSGTRLSVLPDFIIGAHADGLGVPLITRDKHRFKTYFPRLALVAPS